MAAYVDGKRTDLAGTANDATTDSLHGKLGTDTEMGDSSLWDQHKKNWLALNYVSDTINFNSGENAVAQSYDIFDIDRNATYGYGVYLKIAVFCVESLTDAGSTATFTITAGNAEAFGQTNAISVVDVDKAEWVVTDNSGNTHALADGSVSSLVYEGVVGAYDADKTVYISIQNENITGGLIILHCWWAPMDSTSTVTVSA